LDEIVFGNENAGKKKRKKRKTSAAGSDDVVWKNKSIFFRLPYWKDNLLRHNLDVMHIEKKISWTTYLILFWTSKEKRMTTWQLD
jgi:hypothetical protein